MKLSKIILYLQKTPYITKQNLALILAISPEALNYWVKILLHEKYLISLKKGLYVSGLYLDKINQNPIIKEPFVEYLSNIIRQPSYVSLEYVLAKTGIIPESVFGITAITLKSSRVYLSDIASFTYKSIKPSLFCGFEYQKFNEKDIKIASKAKALFDFLYLRKIESMPILRDYLTTTSRINWDALTIQDTIEFSTYINMSKSPKMTSILAMIKKGKVIL